MDDFLYSVKRVQEAKSLKQNLLSVLQKGGFKLSKWQSNVKEPWEKDSDVELVSTLGLEWKTTSDDLKLRRSFAGKDHIQIIHRLVLSQHYLRLTGWDRWDWCLPLLLEFDYLLRHIWQKVLKSWDKENPQDTTKQYFEWLQEIPGTKD